MCVCVLVRHWQYIEQHGGIQPAMLLLVTAIYILYEYSIYAALLGGWLHVAAAFCGTDECQTAAVVLS